MVTLPELTHYTTDQREQLQAYSPAVSRYLHLIKNTPQTFDQKIKTQRHQHWLKAAFASFFESQNVEKTGQYWSQETYKILEECWQHTGLNHDPIALFTIGKLGGYELNLSSDIDLFFISKDAPNLETTKKVQNFIKILNQTDEFGFCYRTDFEIRPGGPSSPLISSIKQFEDFYWNYGEPWHRLAFVRLAGKIGDTDVHQEIQHLAQKYSFRKFLDFTLLDNLSLLRKKLQREKFNPTASSEINIKFHLGGIRDIELFVHSLQVIHGGKCLELKTPLFSQAVEILDKEQLFDSEQLSLLKNTYWFLRQIENLIQLKNDQQTYTVPLPFTFNSKNTLTQKSLTDILNPTADVVSHLLGKVDLDNSSKTEVLHLLNNEQLIELGFSSKTIKDSWNHLINLTSLSTRNDRDERIRKKFLNLFAYNVAQYSLDKNLAFNLLHDFVKSTRAKASFFSMLIADENLIEDLAILFGCSPYLGNIIASRPELLDSFILKRQELTLSEPDTLLEELAEKKLLGQIISSSQFLKTKNLNELTLNLSNSADTICKTLLTSLKKEFPNSHIEILALGKWGGREIGLKSDLDLIFMTNKTPTEEDHKLARRFLTRITGQYKGGSIYDIDMRLRPSGQIGPMIISQDKIHYHLANTAEAWIRQSYLKARSLNSNINLQPFLFQKDLNDSDLSELKTIRNKLTKPLTKAQIDLKYSQGGLIDIEFASQIAILQNKIHCGPSTVEMIEALSEKFKKWSHKQDALIKHYYNLRSKEQFLTLFSGHSETQLSTTNPSSLRLSQYLGIDVSSLIENTYSDLHEIQSLLKNLDPIHSL